MAALADDYQRTHGPVGPQEHTVKDEAVIYTGAMTCTDTNGELLPAANTAGLKFAGVNYGDRVDNTEDGEVCRVDRTQRFVVACAGMAAGDLGKSVYASNDNTVALTTTGFVYVGKIAEVISATKVLVDPTIADDQITTTVAVADAANVATVVAALKTLGLFVNP